MQSFPLHLNTTSTVFKSYTTQFGRIKKSQKLSRNSCINQKKIKNYLLALNLKQQQKIANCLKTFMLTKTVPKPLY